MVTAILHKRRTASSQARALGTVVGRSMAARTLGLGSRDAVWRRPILARVWLTLLDGFRLFLPLADLVQVCFQIAPRFASVLQGAFERLHLRKTGR